MDEDGACGRPVEQEPAVTVERQRHDKQIGIAVLSRIECGMFQVCPRLDERPGRGKVRCPSVDDCQGGLRQGALQDDAVRGNSPPPTIVMRPGDGICGRSLRNARSCVSTTKR